MVDRLSFRERTYGMVTAVARALTRWSPWAAHVADEDALKHLWHCEEADRTGTLQSLAGAMAVAPDIVADVVDRLAQREFVRWEGDGLLLSDAGRRRAVRVIRAHRLWERHLAERTGVEPVDWHRSAERAEHELSPADADRLAAGLGNPAFDPHGDPIPATDGRLPQQPAPVPVNELTLGDRAVVVHVEDEPEGVYARLVTAGLHPGVELVRVADGTGVRLRLTGGEELELAPAEAASLAVRRTPGPVAAAMTLADIALGERTRVVRLAAACRGLERHRLMDLGIVPGTVIEVERRAATGDPTAYRVRASLVALRRKQAARVLVEPLGDA